MATPGQQTAASSLGQSERRSLAVTLYKVYLGLQVALGLLILGLGATLLLGVDSNPGGTTGAAIFLVLGLLWSVPFAVGFVLRPRPSAYAFAVVLIVLGFANVFAWPLVVPLIVMWRKADTKAYFGSITYTESTQGIGKDPAPEKIVGSVDGNPATVMVEGDSLTVRFRRGQIRPQPSECHFALEAVSLHANLHRNAAVLTMALLVLLLGLSMAVGEPGGFGTWLCLGGCVLLFVWRTDVRLLLTVSDSAKAIVISIPKAGQQHVVRFAASIGRELVVEGQSPGVFRTSVEAVKGIVTSEARLAKDYRAISGLAESVDIDARALRDYVRGRRRLGVWLLIWMFILPAGVAFAWGRYGLSTAEDMGQVIWILGTACFVFLVFQWIGLLVGSFLTRVLEFLDPLEKHRNIR